MDTVIVEKKKQTGGKDEVWPTVKLLMEQRVRMGLDRYGEPLMTHNGIDMGILATEEVLDAIMYVTALVMEYNDAKARIAELEEENRDLRHRYEALFHDDNVVAQWAWVERE